VQNPLPAIYISEFLYDQLVEGAIKKKQPRAPLEFIERFRQWISSNKKANAFFGADRSPRGDYIWHVHIAPVSNQKQYDAWNQSVSAGQTPTSNGCIIYASDISGRKHFLIANFVDPTGHDLWNREDEEAVSARETFSKWAKNFYTLSENSKYALSHSDLIKDLARIRASIAATETALKSGTNDN